jgi:hypothetical protein
VDDGTKRPPLTQALDDAVTYYLEQRAMAGVTIQVFSASYVPIFLSMTAHCTATARQDEVSAAVKAQLDYFFRYQNTDFDQTITVHTLYSQLAQIDGLDYVSITRLSLAFVDPDIEVITMDQVAINAVPYFLSDGLEGGNPLLTLTMSGGITA